MLSPRLCLRLLATLSLNQAKSTLIGGLIDSYLALTGQEMAQFEREIARLAPEERKSTMALVSSWERQGIEKGIEKGKEELIEILMQQRFGPVSEPIVAKLDQLSSMQLNDLATELLTFTSMDDIEHRLSRLN